jgi:hypothetical protein
LLTDGRGAQAVPSRWFCNDLQMVAPPSPEYTQKLGVVQYQMAGVEWLAIEVIRRLDPATPIDMLAGLTAHGIADQLRSKVANTAALDITQRDELSAIADDYGNLPPVRNDTAHARPATAPDGQQQLYRWAPTKSTFVGFINDEFLDQLLADIADVSRRLDATRGWLP